MKNLLVLVSDVKDKGRIIKEGESYVCEALADIAKSQDLSISYKLSDCEEEILLEASIEGKIELECYRCLENVALLVNINICESYPATEENIDIAAIANELIVLELPMQPLCDENCKGLCAVCGKNKNLNPCECRQEIIDPRWEKLRQVIKKD
jgi:uncharacterized protein